VRIKIGQGNSNGDQIKKVAGIVRKGGVIIYPTDTVYGIGCDPFNLAAVRRVLEIKRRRENQLPILVSGEDKAGILVEVDKTSLLLMRAFWPGALTIVLKMKAETPSELSFGGLKLGVRMPNHILALRIIEACGGMLIGTSANISGNPPARNVEELDSRLEKRVDLVIDGGGPTLGIASTVIEVGPPEVARRSWVIAPNIRILREGAISADVIRAKLLERHLR
jgi:L-threonylcarbamoyladenylate synthase